jgi:hypothetical protein
VGRDSGAWVIVAAEVVGLCVCKAFNKRKAAAFLFVVLKCPELSADV